MCLPELPRARPPKLPAINIARTPWVDHCAVPWRNAGPNIVQPSIRSIPCLGSKCPRCWLRFVAPCSLWPSTLKASGRPCRTCELPVKPGEPVYRGQADHHEACGLATKSLSNALKRRAQVGRLELKPKSGSKMHMVLSYITDPRCTCFHVASLLELFLLIAWICAHCGVH